MPDAVFTFAILGVWGLCVLAAFIGWGRVLARWALPDGAAGADFGLLAGWGMTVALIAGGVLSALGLVSVLSLTLFVVAGMGLALWRGIPRPDRPAGWAAVMAALAGVALLTRYLGAVSFEALSCSDDYIAYFPMITRLLDTGTLLEPFGFRRLGGYGGQTFLQALVAVVGAEANAYLMDRGIGVIIAFALTLGYFTRRGDGGVFAIAVALMLAVLVPFPMLNSASHVTGLVMFLTLFRTLDLHVEIPADRHRLIAVTGAVVAAAASLRAHYLAGAAPAVLFFWVIAAAQGRASWSAAAARTVATGALSAILLAPWMALLHMSSGTPLYPLLRGNHRLESLSAPMDWSAHLNFMGEVFVYPGIALFAVPVVLHALRRHHTSALALYGGALTTTVAVAWVFTYSDAENIHRYAAPLLMAAFTATAAAFAREMRAELAEGGEGGRAARIGDMVLLAALVFLLPVMVSKDVQRLADHWGRAPLAAETRAIYERLQDAVPEGAPLLVAVSHPFAFDYGRNPIANVDVPGAASPDPGMPFFKGPAAVAAYLKELGLNHVAFRDFDAPGGCLYDRRLWQVNRNRDYAEGRLLAPYYLDFMANVDALAASGTIVFSEAGLRAVRLD